MLPIGEYGACRVEEGNGCIQLVDGDGRVQMTDLPGNWETSKWLEHHARGRVLVVGGGLGLDVDVLLNCRHAERIIVTEANPCIVEALREHYANRLEVTWAGTGGSGIHLLYRWAHTIWLDIWPEYDEASLTECRTEVERLRGLYPALIGARLLEYERLGGG